MQPHNAPTDVTDSQPTQGDQDDDVQLQDASHVSRGSPYVSCRRLAPSNINMQQISTDVYIHRRSALGGASLQTWAHDPLEKLCEATGQKRGFVIELLRRPLRPYS